MLAAKFDALLLSIYSFRSQPVTTCRLVAGIRGKLLHYGQAIPYLAMCAPSLSQLIHGSSSAPSLSEEADLHFNWDQTLQLNARAALACDLAMASLWIMHKHGCPLWPPVPSSLYGNFLSSSLPPTEPRSNLLVCTSDASYLGWAFLYRLTPSDPGAIIIGSFRTLSGLLDPLFLLAQLPSEDPAVQSVREALALLFGLQGLARLIPLSSHQILLRNDCKAALAAFRRGSFRSSALQDIALEYVQLMLSLPAMPALTLFAPGKILVHEGIDHESRAGAAALRCSESGPGLRDLVKKLATTLGWGPLTLDLFATASNTLTCRFFSQFPEPLAEYPDALNQPNWGSSTCPNCGQFSRELVFAFPPEHLLPLTLFKAYADRVRGFIVAPLAITQPFWPRLCAASVLPNHWIELPASPDFVHRLGLSPSPRHALFAVDFNHLQDNPSSFPSEPCCPLASAPRLRLPIESPPDTLDRHHMRLAILSLSSSLTNIPLKSPDLAGLASGSSFPELHV